MLTGNVFITGGAGFLARGIYARAQREGWPCRFTCFSRDDHKHAALLRDFPAVRCVRGDVAFDPSMLAVAMLGHDTVIHAAASKHVDLSEHNPLQTLQTNTFGSINVARAAVEAGVGRVVGISTDKACHPVNIYGASKMAMERVFQEANRWSETTKFHLVRYGNVLSSTGSFLPQWKEMLDTGKGITATSPDMTRFWMSTHGAIDVILKSLESGPGIIVVPRAAALGMEKMAQYIFPKATAEGQNFIRYTGLRPGEKMHEELLTREEMPFVEETNDGYFLLHPVSGTPAHMYAGEPYTSDTAPELTKRELRNILDSL